MSKVNVALSRYASAVINDFGDVAHRDQRYHRDIVKYYPKVKEALLAEVLDILGADLPIVASVHGICITCDEYVSQCLEEEYCTDDGGLNSHDTHKESRGCKCEEANDIKAKYRKLAKERFK